ncbi:MAG: hypothetical protein WCO00_01935 [Rhodospirillaceae bacterium]
MANGVSGALTRLAKITVVSPLHNGSSQARSSSRQRAANEEDIDAYYLPEDLDDLADRRYVRRRTEDSQERAPAVAAPPPPVEPVTAPAGVAPVAAAPAPVAAAPAPMYAEPPRPAPAPRRSGRAAVRFESWEEDEDVVDDGIPVGRGGGRIAERIRRLRTSLAARAGREPESDEAGRDRTPARPATRSRSVDEDGEPLDGDRCIRSSCRPKQVARMRRRLGMTQAEFARCFGLATEDVVRWEAGAKPSRAERVLLTLIMHDPEEMARLVDEALALT